MNADPIVYRRLPGLGASAFEQHRLYQGTDHLLLVASSGFNESYKRFYFREIQDLTLRKTARGQVWNGVWSGLSVIAGSIAMQMDEAAFIVWWVVSGISFALLLFNIVRGPTCVCQIRTAVQVRALAPLNRLRRAQKVIDRLRPLIEAAQTPMTMQELQGRIDSARQGIQATTVPVPTSSPEPFAPIASPVSASETSAPAEGSASSPPTA